MKIEKNPFIGIDIPIKIKKELIKEKFLEIVICKAKLKDIEFVFKKGIEEGIFTYDTTEDQCPRCQSYITGNICPKCNYNLDEPEEETDLKEKDVDDHSDSEDADNSIPNREEEDKLPFDASDPSLPQLIHDFFRDCETSEEHIPIYMDIIERLFSENKEIDEEIPHHICKESAQAFNITEKQIRSIWDKRCFNQEDIIDLYERWKVTTKDVSYETEVDPIRIEIRKVNNSFVPDIVDPYRDLITVPGKKSEIIILNGHKFTADLILRKKNEMLENLYKILNAVIDKRKDFFNAKDPSEAEKLLRITPLKQKDIADICSLPQSVVSRYGEKTVNTPHGLFNLHDFFPGPTPQLRKLVEDLIIEFDKKGRPISDKKIAELLNYREGKNISQRYITEIRNYLGYPTFGKRKVLRKLLEDLIIEFDKKSQPISDKKIAELFPNKEGKNMPQRYVAEIRNYLGYPTFGKSKRKEKK